VAELLNRIEQIVVRQIDLGAACAETSLKKRLHNAEILRQQTLQPEFGFSEQERQDVKGHCVWLSALQKIHFPQSIPAAVPPENPEENNETEQPTASKKHRIDSSDSL
jgi:hypothetical protein